MNIAVFLAMSRRGPGGPPARGVSALRSPPRGAAGGGATAPGQPAAPSKYRYMSVPAPFGTIFVAYGPNGPVMVSQANSPAAFEREAERVLGGGPVADPEPPADLRAEGMPALRD